MYSNSFDDLDLQKRICNYASDILELKLEMHEVKAISEKMLREALKYTITMVADRISECNTVIGLAEYLDMPTLVRGKFLSKMEVLNIYCQR